MTNVGFKELDGFFERIGFRTFFLDGLGFSKDLALAFLRNWFWFFFRIGSFLWFGFSKELVVWVF